MLNLYLALGMANFNLKQFDEAVVYLPRQKTLNRLSVWRHNGLSCEREQRARVSSELSKPLINYKKTLP